jgi:hypothetical protein
MRGCMIRYFPALHLGEGGDEVRPAQACVWTRVFCHSSLSFVATIGILHTNENMGGIMTEDPRLSWPRASALAAHSRNIVCGKSSVPTCGDAAITPARPPLVGHHTAAIQPSKAGPPSFITFSLRGVTPAQPGVTTPAQPGVITPAQPGVTTFAQPGVTTPAQPGVTTPAQPGGPTVGNFHENPCNFDEKWVGILCNREAKGGRAPP